MTDFLDPSARLRQMLEKRREKATTTGLQRIPFVLDQTLSDDLEKVAAQREAVQERVDYLTDMHAERDPDDPSLDVRATGDDLSDDGQALAAAQDELDRLTEALEELTDAARQATVQLVFRRLPAAEYEAVLIRSGGPAIDTDMKAAARFYDALLAASFERVELADGDDSGFGSWQDFAAAADLSFGELDPIRALVYANNRRGGNSIPFSSKPSSRTTTS